MDWIKAESETIFQTYKRQPLVLVRGKGSHVWDERGKKYLDFFSGLAVNNLGHCHPAVARAVSAQVKKLIHTCNLYYTLPQIECARELVRRTFPGKVFFSNSGAEAIECAVKLARRWGRPGGRDEFIAFDRSFHGRTFAALTLTGQEKYRQGFDPLLHKVLYARFNDLESVSQLMSERTSAVFIEPIQGEGGVHVAHPEFLRGLRALCDRRRVLLVFDEIQCGLGRAGQLFAFQQYGVVPDVVAIAKGLGGGLPIGATLAKDSVAQLFGRGDHASTFGGNPVVCSAASAVLKVLSPSFLKSVRSKGETLRRGLENLRAKFPSLVREVRGMGLMTGLELTVPGDPFVDWCREHGMLINCTQGTVLRLLPPLTISPAELKAGLALLEKCFRENVK